MNGNEGSKKKNTEKKQENDQGSVEERQEVRIVSVVFNTPSGLPQKLKSIILDKMKGGRGNGKEVKEGKVAIVPCEF